MKKQKLTQKEQHKIVIKENLAEINESLKYLSKYIGRKLTDKEEEMILDIVDTFTPKNKKGYKIRLMPFYYAWEIYMAAKSSKSLKALSEMIRKYNAYYKKNFLS